MKAFRHSNRSPLLAMKTLGWNLESRARRTIDHRHRSRVKMEPPQAESSTSGKTAALLLKLACHGIASLVGVSVFRNPGSHSPQWNVRTREGWPVFENVNSGGADSERFAKREKRCLASWLFLWMSCAFVWGVNLGSERVVLIKLVWSEVKMLTRVFVLSK